MNLLPCVANGYKILTFTSAKIRPANVPTERYLRAMMDGLKETYLDLDDAVIRDSYLHCLEDDVYRVG